MEREQLRELWSGVLGDLDGREFDPSLTYKSPSLDRVYEQNASSVWLTEDDLDDTAGSSYDDRTLMEAPAQDLEEDYVLLGQLARGGMGLIYLAQQTALQREVALKKAHPQPEIQDRFLSEALVTANLDHPNIVPVYDLVQLDEHPHKGIAIAMKRVGGVSWKTLLHPKTEAERQRAESYDVKKHIELLIQVCNALDYAHSKGITHNDLKPDNVMVGEFGEVFVMDWGLALDVRAQPQPPLLAPHRSTIRGDVFGTPSYMAPELAAGEGPEISPTTDVYLLGGLLYEILTREAPHRGQTMMEVLLHASLSEPKSFPEGVSKSLQAICHKAMKRKPSQRYASVDAFREALRTYLEHRQSMQITEDAKKTLRRCEQSLGHQFAAYDKTRSHTRVLQSLRGDRNKLYIDFAESVAGFVQAQKLWPENEEAKQGELQARLSFAQAAIQHGDLGLAEAQAEFMETKDQHEAFPLFVDLRAATQSRDKARRSARIQRRILWLGGLFLIAGLSIALFFLQTQRDRATRSELLSTQRLSELHRLADLKRLKDYRTQAQHLWPAIPSKAPQMERWLDKARRLLKGLPGHRKALATLRKRGTQLKKKWHFKDRSYQWQHDTLTRLVEALERFRSQTFERIQRRQHFARAVKGLSIGRHRRLWKRTTQAISKLTLYKGLALKPQLGLVPLGRDDQSGLWEFVHIQTGQIPRRDARGRLQIHAHTGLIFVLLPGGRFFMGAHKRATKGKRLPGRRGAIDPYSTQSERPAHALQLRPFFLSKYELTQAQWSRIHGHNPSIHQRGAKMGLHPVEGVPWKKAQQSLQHLGLSLPTEAQWEYAARGGTLSVWWTGSTKQSLRGAGNLADPHQKAPWQVEPSLSDGYRLHAPIGRFRPNPFGLYDMLGNVGEWCLDGYGPYTHATQAHTGMRMLRGPRIVRGGGFRSLPLHARSAHRRAIYTPHFRSDDVGIRPARALDE